MSKNKDSEVNTAVLQYLNKQNRPYSAIDIFNNLHKVHGKTAITRALELLAADRKIVEKTYGKQKIYYSEQGQYPSVSENELASLDSLSGNLSTSISEIQSAIKNCETNLSALNSSLTTEEATAKIMKLEEENSSLENKLENLKNVNVVIPPAEKDKVYKKYNTYVKDWRTRKRIATDIINTILEGYPKPKKTLYEELGIETDEDLNVTIPKQ